MKALKDTTMLSTMHLTPGIVYKQILVLFISKFVGWPLLLAFFGIRCSSEIFETQNNDFSGRGASQNTYEHVLSFYDDNGKGFVCPNRAMGSNYVARPRFVCSSGNK